MSDTDTKSKEERSTDYNKEDLSYKQRQAIHLIVAQCKSASELAEILEVSPVTIKRWMKEPKFIKLLEKKMRKVEKFSVKERLKHNKIITSEIYKEIQKRLIDERNIKQMSLQQLFRAVASMSHEVRIDTPGDVTVKTKIEGNDIDDITTRFAVKKKKDKKKALSLVTPPKEKKNVG